MVSLLEKLAEYQEKYPIAILSVVLVVSVFLFVNAINLKTDASFDTMFGPKSDHVQLKNLVSNEFGSTDTLYILVTLDEDVDDISRIQDVREPEVLKSIKLLKRSLLEEPSVSQVFSVVDVIEQTQELPETLEGSKIIFNSLPKNILKDIIAKDFSASNIIVEMDVANKPGSLEKAEEKIKEKIANAITPLGIEFVLTGEPTLINRIMNLLIADNLKTVGIAIIFITFILIGYFRSGGIGILAVIPLLLALTWLAGTMVILGIRVTFMTAAVGSMMVGMGIDYSIHMTHGFLKQLKAGKQHATKISVMAVGSALTASALTTIAGFLAMLFGISPSSKIQGLVLSLGIFYAFIATVIVLPCLLVAYKKLVYSDMDKIIFKLSDEEKEEKTKGLLWKLAQMQIARPKTILIIFFVLTIFIVPGMARLWMDTSNDNWIPPNDPVMAALDEVSNKFGGLESQNFLLMIDPETNEQESIKDLRDPVIMKKVFELDKSMEKGNEVSSFKSPADNLIAANNGKIPQDIEEIKNIINNDEQARNYFNKDFTILKLTATGDSFGGNNPSEANDKLYFEWLYEAESVNFPEGVFYQGQDGIRSDLELNNLLEVDTMKTTGIGFLFVFTIALLIYRSLVIGMLAILPIIFAIIWTIGIMGWTNLPFTVLTSGMMAIVMGMGIDFSIHLIHNTKSMLKKGKDIAESVTSAVTSTGEAMSVTTLTTVVGFSSLILATLLATKRLGLTLAIAVFSAFVICMLIVPATLVIEHNFKKRKKLRGK